MSVLKSPQFWEQFCANDPAAWQKYLGLICDTITKACFKACEHYDNVRGDDLDGEVLECTIRRTRRYFCPVQIDLSKNPRGYLYITAYSCAALARDRRIKMPIVHTDEVVPDAPETDSPSYRMQQSENIRDFEALRKSLGECIEGLPPKEQIAFTYRKMIPEYEELSWKELADVIQREEPDDGDTWPVPTLKDRYDRGKEKVWRCMRRKHPRA